MPVKLGSSFPSEKEARIEIIPLIDIMFFLLAAFMLVSLSMVNVRSVRVNVPAAAAADPEAAKNLVSIAVDRSGIVWLNGAPAAPNELAAALAALARDASGPRVLISGDQDARHGDVIRVMDLVRAAGIEKVAFETRAPAADPGR